MTGTDLAKGVLGFLGAWSPADGDAPPDADSSRVIFWGNLLRTSWNTSGLYIAVTSRSPYTWPAAAATRTIGLAGQLVGVMPQQILFAKLIPAGGTAEQTVNVLTERQYAAIDNKAQTGDVFHDLRYEQTGVAVATITVWPVPTTAPTLVLHHQGQYPSFAITDTLAFPESAEGAFTVALAKLCAPVMGKSWTREQEDLYRMLTATWQSSNLGLPDEVPMPPGVPGRSRGTLTKAAFDGGRF